MCGIFFSCSLDKHRTPSDSLRANLSRRGPDNISTVLRSVTLGTVASPDLFPKWHNKVQCLTFVTTVLSLRGDSIVSQPLEDQSSGSLFCWNGEAWKIDDHVVQGNDAKPVFDLLLNATRPNPLIVNGRPASYEQSLRNFVNALSSVTGPFAFLFYDAPHQRVFYGRDVLGRRSLLIKRSSINFDLSSISGSTDTENWSEVEADGLYLLDLTKCPESSALALDRITCIPWVTGKPKCELTYALV